MGFENLNLLKTGPAERIIVGADCSGSKETPNETWIAVGNLVGNHLEVTKLQKVGMHALGAELAALAPAAAGLDFPFSLPVDFLKFMAEKFERSSYQSWQEVAEQLVFTPYEQFLELTTTFKKEPKRFTDASSCAQAASPLHRVNPSMVQMTYHGMRVLAQLNPKKFAVLPFQDVFDECCSVYEVYPRAILKCLNLQDTGYKSKDKKDVAKMQSIRHKILHALVALKDSRKDLPADFPRLEFPKKLEHLVVDSDHALDGLVACYGTAILAATPELFHDPFSSDNLDVLLEGWIYEPVKILQPA